MKSIKLIATGALLMGAASLVVPSMASETQTSSPREHHWMGKGGYHHKSEGLNQDQHTGRWERMLKLTDAQKETIQSQREAEKTARKALRQDQQAALSALHNAAAAGANEAELSALADEVGRVHAQQALAQAKSQQAFLAILTAEQRQTLAELKNKRFHKGGVHKEGFHKGPRTAVTQ